MKVSKPIPKMTAKEIAELYGMDVRTFLEQWVSPDEDKIGIRCGNYYKPKQIRKMFSLFDPPPSYQVVE